MVVRRERNMVLRDSFKLGVIVNFFLFIGLVERRRGWGWNILYLKVLILLCVYF